MSFSILQRSLFYQMIVHAGPMAKFVLIILTLMSLVSWAIIINKWWLFKRVKRQGRKFLEIFWGTRDLKLIQTEARNYSISPVSLIYQSAFSEFKRWTSIEKETFLESVTETMRKTAQLEQIRLRQGLTFLATVGNTAPFIGLFGTVWGIMRAFHDIGLKGSASLTEVAPGISEALVATAFGLAAAIPAVIGYNYFIQSLVEQRIIMENFMIDVLTRIRRHLKSKGERYEGTK